MMALRPAEAGSATGAMAAKVLDRIKAIQQARNDPEALGQLQNLEEEGNLRPPPCPQAAQELQALENTGREEKERLEALQQQVLDTINAKVAEGAAMSSEPEKEARSTARTQCSTITRRASERVTSFWSEVDVDDEAEQQRLLSERVQNRFVVTLQAADDCLTKSSWPLTLEPVYKQQEQAEIAESSGAQGERMANRCDAVVAELTRYREDLDGRHRQSGQKVSSSREKVRKGEMRFRAALTELQEAAEEYLSDSIIHEHYCAQESNIAEAKDDAEMMQERADAAHQLSHTSCTTLVDQAAQIRDEIRHRVKAAAVRLHERAQEPAEMSVANTEMCRQLAQKLKQEKDNQLELKRKELCEVTAEKAELESQTEGKGLDSKLRGDLVRARNKERRLQDEEMSLSRQVQQAKNLCDRASQQLKDLLQLQEAKDGPNMESVKYVFNMDEIKQTAEEEVTRAWMETAFTMPSEERANQLSQTLATRGKDPLQELMQKLERAERELAKEKAYRQNDQEENKRMIQELRNEFLRRDDDRSVGSFEVVDPIDVSEPHGSASGGSSGSTTEA